MSTILAQAQLSETRGRSRFPGIPLFQNSSETPVGYSGETDWLISQSLHALLDYVFPVSRANLEIEDRFMALKDRWKQETWLSSSITEITNSPAYREIIDMGWDAVALILTELESEPDLWFGALQEITGDNPVQLQNRGDIEGMARDWLNWADQQDIPQ